MIAICKYSDCYCVASDIYRNKILADQNEYLCQGQLDRSNRTVHSVDNYNFKDVLIKFQFISIPNVSLIKVVIFYN